MSRLYKSSKGKHFHRLVHGWCVISCHFFVLISQTERDDAEFDDADGSRSLGDDVSDNSSGEESLSDPDIATILEQRRGKKRVLSDSPIKAPDHLQRTPGYKSKERYQRGIAYKILK